MFIHHYTLKSTETLPPSPSCFIDPLYRLSFTPNVDESISDFIERISGAIKKRSKIESPGTSTYIDLLTPVELTDLVEASLLETTPRHLVKIYFVQAKFPIRIGQMKTFAKAASRELLNRIKSSNKSQTDVPDKTLERIISRASHCSKCPLHRTKTKMSSIVDSVAKSLLPPASKNAVNTLFDSINTAQNANTNKYLRVLPLDSSPSGAPEISNKILEEMKQLGTCGMCGCSLKTKVGYSLLSVLVSITPDQFSLLYRTLANKMFSTCWILAEAASPTAPQNIKDLVRKKLKVAFPGTNFDNEIHPT